MKTKIDYIFHVQMSFMNKNSTNMHLKNENHIYYLHHSIQKNIQYNNNNALNNSKNYSKGHDLQKGITCFALFIN